MLSSPPPSRKRSKWDNENELRRDIGSPPSKKSRVPITSHSQPASIPRPLAGLSTSVSTRSAFAPIRTAHPPLLPSRSVYCYEKLNQIEEGSYGVVFRARDKQTGEIVALKKLKLDEEKQGFPITSLREINALMICRHENVVGIREVVVGDTLTQYVINRVNYLFGRVR